MRTYQRGCPMLLYCPHPGELCRGPPVLEGRWSVRLLLAQRGSMAGSFGLGCVPGCEGAAREAQLLLYLLCHSTCMWAVLPWDEPCGEVGV